MVDEVIPYGKCETSTTELLQLAFGKLVCQIIPDDLEQEIKEHFKKVSNTKNYNEETGLPSGRTRNYKGPKVQVILSLDKNT